MSDPSIARSRRAASSTSRVRLHLEPGQKGTKQLVAQYGDRLVYVRYRYDPTRGKRLETVELIVGERDWQARQPSFASNRVVALRVAFSEGSIRARVKQAGGTWNREQGLWQLRYDRAVALGLSSRIVGQHGIQ